MSQPANKFKCAWWVKRAIEDRTSNLLAVTAGLGSGKSHGALQWLYHRIKLNRRVEYFAYSMPVYELIHNTAIPKTRKVLEALGLEEGTDYHILKSPHPKCVFRATGQELHYISGSRPDKIKSVEYGCAVIDEPGVTPKDSKDRIRERTRDARAECIQILQPGTPEGLNDYADDFNSDEGEGWDRSRPRDHILVRKVSDGTTRQLRRFRLTTYDNQEFLPPGYISDLLDTYRGNPNYVKAYILGFFVPLIQGGCYSNYAPQKHDCDDINPQPFTDIDLTWDFNADPLAWVSIQSLPFELDDVRAFKDVAIHEANEGSSNIEDAVAEFAYKHPVGRFSETTINLFGDSSGHAESHKVSRTDYQAIAYYLRRLGYKRVNIMALRFNPLETESVDALNRAFLDDRFFMCRRLKMLRRSIIATRWKDNVRKIDKPSGKDTWTHHSDAVKYRFYARQFGAGQQISARNY